MRKWYHSGARNRVVPNIEQQSFSDMEYSNRKQKTKLREFPGIIEEIIPRDKRVSAIVPHYPSVIYGFSLKSIVDML